MTKKLLHISTGLKHVTLGVFIFLMLLIALTACGTSTQEASEEEDALQKPAAEKSIVPYSRGPTQPPRISAPKSKPPQ